MNMHIITGMSGAGKSLIMKAIEDLGFYCIDNMPPKLIPEFVKMYEKTNMVSDVAIVVDIRGGDFLDEFFPAINQLEVRNVTYDILFLEANDKNLVKRYKETRRNHPLSNDKISLFEAIKLERIKLEKIKNQANFIIDSSDMHPKQLREEIKDLFVSGEEHEKLMINIVSFGFKYGTPLDSDLIFDVRFLPNPYYNTSMRKLTGKNEVVRNYVLKHEQTQIFINKLEDLIEFLIPYYIQEGKTQLVVGIGCTGGRHRSVTIADRIAKILKDNNHRLIIKHRDIDNDGKK
ncbi:MAG: RNase adapter RapZ [Clostridiales bacterium]|nr:RNase adapter RapZ [Clostridiales bacterium]